MSEKQETVKEGKRKNLTGVARVLDFHFLELGLPGYKRYDYTKSARWRALEEAEQNRTLQDLYPRHDRPIAALFRDSSMKDEALVVDADEEGNWGTDDTNLAALVLESAKQINPTARLHPWSKPLSAASIEAAKKVYKGRQQRVARAS